MFFSILKSLSFTYLTIFSNDSSSLLKLSFNILILLFDFVLFFFSSKFLKCETILLFLQAVQSSKIFLLLLMEILHLHFQIQ